MAILSLKGTVWKLNETLQIPPVTIDASINFKANNSNYSRLFLQTSGSGYTQIFYDNINVWSGSKYWSRWEQSYEAFSKIEIIDGDSVNNQDLIDWLTTHATLLYETNTYSHLYLGENKIQVDSAIRDGVGGRIDTKYATKEEVEENKQNIFQYSEIPTADSTNVGKIIQYVGETNESYINGYFYKCVENEGSYNWDNMNIQNSSGGSGEGGGSSVPSDIIDILNNKVSLTGNEVIEGQKYFTEIPKYHKKRLPSEYTEVEYIESTGSQYVNTGVPFKTGFSCEIKFNMLSTTGDVDVLSVSDSSGNCLLVSYLNGTPRVLPPGANIAMPHSIIHTVKIDYNTPELLYNIDDTTKYNLPLTNYVSVDGLYLFVRTSTYGFSKAILYYCKMYQDDILVRDLVPCYCNNDNKIGLYDLVENKFYPNQGTGEFLKGDIVGTNLVTMNDIKNDVVYNYLPVKLDLQNIINEKGSATYGFNYSSNYSQYFDEGLVSSNFGVGESYSYAKIIFDAPRDNSTLKITYYNSCEVNYDYALISNLDQELSYSTATDSERLVCNPPSGAGEVVINDISKGQHFITIKYRKDGLKNEGLDLFAITGIYLTSQYPTLTDRNKENNLYPITEIDAVLGLSDKLKEKGNYVSLTGNEVIEGQKVFKNIPTIGELKLPKEFTEVEYIEFTGSQYIDTEIIPSNHFTEVKFNMPVYVNEVHLFGTSAGAAYYNFTPFNSRWYWGTGGSEGNAGTFTTGVHVLEFNKGSDYQILIDNNLLGSGRNIYSTTNLCIGRRTDTNYRGYIYYFKIYDKSTNLLVRDFVPCYVNTEVTNNGVTYAANTIGLYDLVENKFYTNSGSGTFAKGENVLTGEELALKSEVPNIPISTINDAGKFLMVGLDGNYVLENLTQAETISV